MRPLRNSKSTKCSLSNNASNQVACVDLPRKSGVNLQFLLIKKPKQLNVGAENGNPGTMSQVKSPLLLWIHSLTVDKGSISRLVFDVGLSSLPVEEEMFARSLITIEVTVLRKHPFSKDKVTFEIPASYKLLVLSKREGTEIKSWNDMNEKTQTYMTFI